MKSGAQQLTWNSIIPERVHRRHEEPNTSDNYGAIDRAAAEPIGHDELRTNDTNGQAYWCKRLGRYVASGAHWHHPYENGYTRVKRWHRIGTRPMTAAEIARKTWDWDQVRRCRRPNGEKPRTVAELYAYGAVRGVVQIIEEKNAPFGRIGFMRHLVVAARNVGHPAWFMVLDNMAPRDKVAATKGAGGQIAIIAGSDGLHLPPHFDSWPVKPDRIWA